MKEPITIIHKSILNITFMFLLMWTLSCVAVAQEQHNHSQEMKAPQTAQEHKARASEYQKKAEEYRNEAEAHRKMLPDYSKTVARNPKDTIESRYIKKMRLHCQKFSKAAEALAQEAEEMAKFHTMRAKEIEGK